MKEDTKVLGIVTARSGSKGIPHKNLYPVAGAPLVYYCIQAAQSSGIFDRLIISTDDEKIAEVAKGYGIEVPFMRPKHLAEDDTPHLPVIQHALNSLEEKYDYAAIIQPTAPTLQKWHWQEAWELLGEKDGDSVISVMEIPTLYHPAKALIQADKGLLITDHRRDGTGRQSLPKAYYSTAGLYIFKTKNLDSGNFYGEKIIPYEIDADYAIDINELEDIDRARESICLIMPPDVKEKDEEEYKKLCKEYERI